MRDQDRSGLTSGLRRLGALAAGVVVAFVAAAAFSQVAPRLTGANPPTETTPTPPLAMPETDLARKMRAYPEQPPIIPHSIEGYQLSVSTNRCLQCHRRQYTEASGAPMISVTHFMDRDGQMLADVSPRRYFCLQCHVQQTEARPLVDNTFVDMINLGPGRE